MNPIVIIEGPAGSGKSYLAHRLSEAFGLKVIKTDLPVRKPSATQAPVYSFFGDLQKMTRALTSPGAIIDRWELSQAIYGTLRRFAEVNNEWPTNWPKTLQTIPVNSEVLVSNLYQDLCYRYEAEGRKPPQNPAILWVVNAPSVKVIEERRALAGSREFPWPAHVELDLYLGVPCRRGPLSYRWHINQQAEGLTSVSREVERFLKDCGHQPKP